MNNILLVDFRGCPLHHHHGCIKHLGLCLKIKSYIQDANAQWESVLVVGGQQFAHFTIWKNFLLSISPSKHNQFKTHKKCPDIST